MKIYTGFFECCPHCGRPDTIGRIPRKAWMRLIPRSKHINCLYCNVDFMIIGQVDIRENFSVEALFKNGSRQLYIQDDRDDINGPLELEELIVQAKDTRIGPQHRISADRQTWFSVSEIKELEMNWLVRLPDGTRYGPVHINAVKELFRSEQIGHDTAAKHKNSPETVWVADL